MFTSIPYGSPLTRDYGSFLEQVFANIGGSRSVFADNLRRHKTILSPGPLNVAILQIASAMDERMNMR